MLKSEVGVATKSHVKTPEVRAWNLVSVQGTILISVAYASTWSQDIVREDLLPRVISGSVVLQLESVLMSMVHVTSGGRGTGNQRAMLSWPALQSTGKAGPAIYWMV